MNQNISPTCSIHCHDLTVFFPIGPRRLKRHVSAVDQVTLDIPSGQITSLVGPSGCGKTTLLRAVAGLQRPTSGTIQFDPDLDSARGKISFVFQQPALLPWRSTLENVMLPLSLLGGQQRSESDWGRGNKQRQVEQATDILSQVGLGDSLHRFPHQLSGGMQMRVSIARALVTSPQVLLLDEPFAALDDMLRNQLGELLLRLWEEHQFTAVMVTHNIAEAILLSHQVVVMKHGQCNDVLVNPLPRPRNQDLRRTAGFGEFYGLVNDQLHNNDDERLVTESKITSDPFHGDQA